MLTDLFQGSLADAQAREKLRPLSSVEAAALEQPQALSAFEALAPADHIKVIAEVKRASPSRGYLAEIAEPQVLASTYAAGGASVVSVLTEERKFKGSLDDLVRVRNAVDIPVLRKDFIGNAYQVFEARAAGADMVLLIVAALPQQILQELHTLILDLGMTPLVEAHTAEEVARAVDLGSAVIGVNARDLTTFELDRELFARVADQIPQGVIRVAESAVLNVDDVVRYREAGADAVLVGEALVTDGDPVTTLASFVAVA